MGQERIVTSVVRLLSLKGLLFSAVLVAVKAPLCWATLRRQPAPRGGRICAFNGERGLGGLRRPAPEPDETPGATHRSVVEAVERRQARPDR